MRVRIARGMYNNPSLDTPSSTKPSAEASGKDLGYDTNIFDSPHLRNGVKDDAGDTEDDVSKDEQKVLDRVGEDLARLGRVKRVGLGVQEKIEFVKIWTKRRR